MIVLLKNILWDISTMILLWLQKNVIILLIHIIFNVNKQCHDVFLECWEKFWLARDVRACAEDHFLKLNLRAVTGGLCRGETTTSMQVKRFLYISTPRIHCVLKSFKHVTVFATAAVLCVWFWCGARASTVLHGLWVPWVPVAPVQCSRESAAPQPRAPVNSRAAARGAPSAALKQCTENTEDFPLIMFRYVTKTRVCGAGFFGAVVRKMPRTAVLVWRRSDEA